MSILGIYARKSIDNDNTSIDQQKNAGIEFCKKNNFQYQIYEDIKSGYKIEDENDPFVSRPGIMKLISDIENKIIDKVWVWENTRLSRNSVTQFYLNQIFIKHNTLLYINGIAYDMNNPQDKLMRGILDNISEFERQNIVARIRRGVNDTINRGIRSYGELYGYKKEGKNGKYVNWVPVNSEIEKLKFVYEKYLEGNTLISIISGMYKNKTRNDIRILTKRWTVIIKQFNYTGYVLNTEGLQLYNKFKNNEIDSIKEIDNEKYYIKSSQFPLKLISIQDWIKIIENFKIKSYIFKDKKRERLNSEIATGIISCPHCKEKYYSMIDKGYKYYRHLIEKSCSQKPKTVKIEKADNIFELFFFYFYLVYDDTKIIIEENQKLIKINQAEIKEKIKTIEKNNRDIEEQIDNFKTIYKSSKDIKKLEIIIEKEIELKSEREINNNDILKLKNEIEDLQNKLNKDKMELTFYDVRELIINYFENMKNEEKRAALIKIIKSCLLFKEYLIINTGKILFIYNIKQKYKLPEIIYNEFKNNELFMDNYLNSSSVINDEGILKIINDWLEYNNKNENYKELSIEENYKQIKNLSNYFKVRKLDDLFIQEIFLSMPENKIQINEKFEKLGIKYDLSNINKIILFTDI